MRDLLDRAAGRRRPSEVSLQLDNTPTGEEEYRDFPDQFALMGFPYDEDEAKTRIDRLARRLAFFWTLFLMYIVIAQGNSDGTTIHPFGWTIQILPRFHLASSEFIAVFTTTTASVFGFLVIVASYLFKRRR